MQQYQNYVKMLTIVDIPTTRPILCNDAFYDCLDKNALCQTGCVQSVITSFKINEVPSVF